MKQMKKRVCGIMFALVCVPTGTPAFEWSAVSSKNGSATMIDYIVVSGGVSGLQCIWQTPEGSGNAAREHGMYATQSGDRAYVKINVDLRHLTPGNCTEALDMLNGSGVWDVRLNRSSVFAYTNPVPPNQFHVFLYRDAFQTNRQPRAFIYTNNPPSATPPKPASCVTYQVPSIDFGTIDPKEISGRKATSIVVLSCDKKASVRVRFMTREGLAIYQMDNGLTTYLKIDDNPGTNGSYQTVAENASSPARAFNLSAELLGTSGSVKPGAFSYTAVVRVDIL